MAMSQVYFLFCFLLITTAIAEWELNLDPPAIGCLNQISTSSEGSCFNCDQNCKNNENASGGICQFGVCYCRTCFTPIDKP
ncbi:hypothetical protein P3L10_029804 [Capsicum annuum]